MSAAPRRSVHRTQWAAQFAVASELCKKGYEVAFTMGNHPSIDLMVRGPKGTPFHIDVKGLYKPNFWTIREKDERSNLFYVLAFVPDEGKNEYFVLTQLEANAEIASELELERRRKQAKGSSLDKVGSYTGLGWGTAKRYQDAWSSLPDWA